MTFEEWKEKHSGLIENVAITFFNYERGVDTRTCFDELEYLLKRAFNAEKSQWHDLRKDPNDLPTGEVNLDMYPDFMKSRVKHRVKVLAKVFFKGHKNPNPWEEVLYYEDGHWLKQHYIQGTQGFIKELPKCEYVLAWCEIHTFDKEYI